jgi:CRISPR-associated endonuclease/helicase Cas3
MKAFDGSDAALVVTTQVAEMSLDLSADLLVTEIAPIPALVQRLGRLNRRASPKEPGTPKDAIAIDPGSSAPYEDSDIRLGETFWDRAVASDAPLSQAELNALMHSILGHVVWPPAHEPVAVSQWLTSGPVSVPGTLREAEMTATVLLESDHVRLEAALRIGAGAFRDEILKCAVPIPARSAVWGWKRHPKAPFYPVAPANAISYTERWGAEWSRSMERSEEASNG